ncbi:MAG: S8 family serine peptidase [Bacteroidales bacterium]|nr:S8 family serine peptidase [Bacteroidales bacterium]
MSTYYKFTSTFYKVLFLFAALSLTLPLSSQVLTKPDNDPGKNDPAQENKTSTSGKESDKVATYAPLDIVDALAPQAVTYQEMELRAKYHTYIPGEIVVAMELGTSKANAASVLGQFNWQGLFVQQGVKLSSVLMKVDRGSFRSIALVLLSLPEGLEVFDAMKKLEGKSGVLWSSPNFIYDGDPREFIPNDPSYASQYHHPLMNNHLAWDITLGSSSIIVGITDDGVELTHSDLAPNIWVNAGEIAGNGIDDDGNGYIDDVNGWDFSNGNNNPNPDQPSHSHGTHVAGITAARTDNAIGVAGVAGHSTIMPLQFYNNITWTAAMINETFTYAADNGAKIVNTSYNIDGWVGDPVFTAGLQYLYDAGVLHLNSAGNNSQLNPPRQAFQQTLLVASTDNADVKSSFSNYGNGVDVSAPGSLILSTVTGNSYDYYSGTSMATPNAAGVAALIWSANPTWTRDQVAAQLLATADNIDASNPTRIGLLGSGRVNSYAALTAALEPPQVKSLVGLPAEGTTVLTGDVNTFSVVFNQVMNPASVNDLANFELRSAGLNGIFGDADDELVPLTTNLVYMVGTNQMTFQISNLPLTCGNYRFSLLSGGLENPFGTDLDGDGNGTGGDHYVRNFSVVDNYYYFDGDGDGYGTGAPLAICSPGSDYVLLGGDCDDADPLINPGASEMCDGVDNNCDGIVDFPSGESYVSSDVPMAISTSGTPTVTSTLTISGATGDIVDLNVKNLDVLHTWMGDLKVTLTSPGGTVFILFDRPGYNGSGFGCSQNNILVTFDDEAALTADDFETTCNSSSTTTPPHTYAISGSYQPIDLLSSLNGTSPNGLWTLTVFDSYTGDGGSIEGWGLEISVPVATTTYYADTDGDGYGDLLSSVELGCTPTDGFVLDNTDCDDTNPDINPAATEVCDGVDNNCDGQIDEGGICCPPNSTYTINDLGDEPDVIPGDGICATASGVCTLRAAVMEVNALTGCSPLTIDFDITGTIDLSTSLPAINHPDLIIDGPGAEQLTVQRSSAVGTPEFRIFTINTAKTVLIDDLTLRNGYAQNGGAIQNNGDLTVNHCIISGNTGTGNGGGGIANYGILVMNNCLVSGNTSTFSGGGLLQINGGTTTATSCRFTENSALYSSAIGNQGISIPAQMYFINCIIDGNISNSESALGTIASGAATSVNLLNCSVIGNTGPYGVICNSNAGASTLTYQNSIFYNPGSTNIAGSGFSSLGNNISSDGSGNLTESGDMPNTDPNLASLTDPFPLECSPAIDNGNDDANSTANDFAGNPRKFDAIPGGSVIDIGAYEYQNQSPVTGDPSQFGDNVWNVYAWNAGGAQIPNNDAWNLNYSGYYVETNLSFNTEDRWPQAGSPSDADGYVGCPVGIDYHSFSYKRKGFSDGVYTINVDNHDDAAQLFINGTNVWEHNGCCDSHPGVWAGTLGAGDEVEFRVTEAGGGSLGKLSFIPGDPTQFGNGAWNVYVWNAGGAGIPNNSSWALNYSGYYVDDNLNIDTQDRWDLTGAPSDASGYQGNPVGIDYHSYSYKRKGFPAGSYELDVDGHDDAAQLFINGTKVWEHNGCCDVHHNVWSGTLGLTDEIEFRVTEGGGGSLGALTFVECPGISRIFVDADATGANTGASWTDAFTDLQAAFSHLCSEVTEVWVASGTYYPTTGTDRTVSFIMKNGTAIYGGFEGTEDPLSFNLDDRDFTANETILSGDIGAVNDTSDNSYHVVFNYHTYLDNSAVIDGFTITGGNANSDIAPHRSGGGFMNRLSAPAISNCIIKENFAVLHGAGIWQYDPSNTSYISNSSILYNSAGNWGGGIFAWNDLDVSDCIFDGNHADNAGGIFMGNGVLELANSIVKNNTTVYQGSAINIQDSPGSTITNCLITGNSSETSQGGIANYNSYGPTSVLTLINTTIANNTSQAPYAGVWSAGTNSKINLINSLVANNSPVNFYADAGSTISDFISMGNNLDSDGTSGFLNGTNGDIVGFDPLFISDDDFHLQPCSPAIDAGNNTDAPGDDLDGNARPFSPMGNDPATVDIGCFEYSITTDICAICPAMADAGNDGGIFPGDQYEILDATAENYISVFWTTSGDGSFDDETILNPLYTPGINDIAAGGVELTLSIEGLNTCGIGDNDQMFLSIYQPPTVEITAPLDGDIFYDYALTVEGTAADINNDLVVIFVNLNGGGWEPATGTNNWSKDLMLATGENLIQAKAMDAQGLESAISEITVILSIQIISIPEGWSIISSYLNPNDPALEVVMEDVTIPGNLTIMLGKNGIFWPDYSINTIGNWNVFEGYKVKYQQAVELTIHGNKLNDNSVTFSEGFHIIPVLSNVPSLISEIFADPANDLKYMFDLTSGQIYWPLGGIQTLTTLLPGKGYLANFNKQVNLNFPEYQALKSSAVVPDFVSEQRGPWEYSRSGEVHFISLFAQAVDELGQYSHIGAFNSNGDCIGFAELAGKNQNILLTVYGNDATNENKTGADVGEMITFRGYDPATGREMTLEAIYDHTFTNHDGLFALNGLSAIVDFKESTTGFGVQALSSQISVYPNPADDLVTIYISSNDREVTYAISDVDGKLVYQSNFSGSETSLNVSDFKPGIYMIRLEIGGEIFTRRLVVM